MEAALLVRCECRDSAQRDLFLRFLAEATRPILEEDVEPAQRATFAALDKTGYPEWLAAHGDHALQINWWLGGWDTDEEAQATLNDLLAAGAVDVYACLWFEGGSGMFVYSKDGDLKTLRGAAAELEDIADDDTEAVFALLDRLRMNTTGTG